MDACLIDITLEFLAIAFHSILYNASVYPQSVFETKKKYNLVVHQSMHPEINEYINLCLKTVAECLKNDQLNCVVFAVTDNRYNPVIKFVFHFEKNCHFDDTSDAYLVQCEENLRAFCLKLSSLSYKFKEVPEDSSFTINIHTNESMAVALACDPNFENFPFIEREQQIEESDTIIPLRRFSIRSYNVDSYIEI